MSSSGTSAAAPNPVLPYLEKQHHMSVPWLYHPQKMLQTEVVGAGVPPVWQCPREVLQGTRHLPPMLAAAGGGPDDS